MQTSPRCDFVTYRRILGKGDTIHDFCDIERVYKKLIYGQEQGFIKSTIDTRIAATNIYNKIFSLMEVDSCGIQSFDENGLLKIFYGERKSIEQDGPISTNYSELAKQISLSSSQHLEYQIPYEDVTTFINLLNTISPTKYIMDHTYLSPFLCSLPQKVGANTIAKAYDRTIENKEDECNLYVDVTNEKPILTKTDGEVFFFDEIYITGNMTLGWTGAGMSGIIDINKMIQTKTYAGLENLTTAIIAFHQGIQPLPSPILFASNDILKICYGLDINEFVTRGILDQYLLALTDLKRMGDLLQVKLATKLGATFISNDRMSILLSTIGYNHRSIRTSKTPSSNERSDRIIALYNFDSGDTTKQLEEYYTKLLSEYDTYVNQYLRIIKLSLDEMKTRQQFDLDTTYEQCQIILKQIQANFSLNPIITKFDPIESTTGRVPRHYNPHWINKNIIIYRGLFKYIEYLSVVLLHLKYLLTVDFTNFRNTFNTILYDNSIDKSLKLKFDDIKKLFDTNKIHHPNTLLKIVSMDAISSSLFNLRIFVSNLVYAENINEIVSNMEQDNLRMPLFGEPIEYYKKSMVKLFKDILPTPLTTTINDIPYTIGLASNPEKSIEIVTDIEKYFTNLMNRYSQIGGRRKNKTKKGGNNDLSESLPDDIVDQTLTKLISNLYEAESEGRMEDVKYYFVIYMQLQLITQQFDISLPLIAEATADEVAISNQKLSEWTMKQQKLMMVPQQIPTNYSQIPRPMTTMEVPVAAAAGGNKKSKKEVKEKKSSKSRKN